MKCIWIICRILFENTKNIANVTGNVTQRSMHIMLLLTPFLNATRGYLLKVITYCCKNDTYEIKFLKDKHEKRFYYFNKKSFAIYS